MRRFVRIVFYLSLFCIVSGGPLACDVYTTSIQGNLSGLEGTLILQNNGTSDLTLTANGPFSFDGVLPGSSYSVTVLTQPSGQICTVTNGTGRVPLTSVTDLIVTCSNESQTYTLGGSISTLVGTLILENSDGQQVSVTDEASFTFATSLANGSPYEVTVNTNPDGQTCVPSSNSGTIDGANVTNVLITCATDSVDVFVGGTVSGLGLSLDVEIQNNGSSTTTLNADGPYSFVVPIGASYAIEVLTQPTGQTCTITSCPGSLALGVCSGTANATINDIDITCVDDGPKKIFVTSTVTQGNLIGGISGADAICMADANKPSGSSTYRAMLVLDTGTSATSRIACTTADCSGGIGENTNWVLQPLTDYYQVDGFLFIGTTNAAGIFAFPLNNSLTSTVFAEAWTGFVDSFSPHWTTSSLTCGAWDSAGSGAPGFPVYTTYDSIGDGGVNNSCTGFTKPLICVQQ